MSKKNTISSPEEWNREAARQAEELIQNSDAEALRLVPVVILAELGELWDSRILSKKWEAPDFDKISNKPSET